MRIEIEGTQAEVTTLLGAFGDAGLRASIQEFSSTLAVFGAQLESIMQTELEVVAALDAANEKLGLYGGTLTKVSAETTGLQDAIAALLAAAQQPGAVSPAVEAALGRVVASVDSLGIALKAHDDQVVDPVDPNAP
jgi:hypothetical protein